VKTVVGYILLVSGTPFIMPPNPDVYPEGVMAMMYDTSQVFICRKTRRSIKQHNKLIIYIISLSLFFVHYEIAAQDGPSQCQTLLFSFI
jgi:hypothetical protein